MQRAIVAIAVVLLVAGACGREALLEEMRDIVPLREGGSLIEAKEIPGEGEAIIQYEIEAVQSSEDDIIEFYRSKMTDEGWEFEDIERYAGDGSVFSMTHQDWGRLTIQTITKQIKQTGKIRVVLNLKRE